MRSSVDVIRLIVGLGLMLVGVGTASLFDSTFVGLAEDGVEMAERFPDWLRDVPAAVLAVAVVAAAATTLAASLVATRYRRAVMLGAGFGLAAGLSLLLGELVDSMVDESVRQLLDTGRATFRYRGDDGRVGPGDPLLAGAVAMLGVASSYVARSVTRRLAILLAAYAAVSIVLPGIPAVGLITDVGAGIAAASAVLLTFGRHDLAPGPPEIVAALASIGITVTDLAPIDTDARRSVPWTATTSTHRTVFVKAVGRSERSSALLDRIYRRVRVREPGDRRALVSVRRAVEHEALVSLQSAALGIRTPALVGVTGAGIDGMVLVYESVEGSTADEVGELDHDVLVATWTLVRDLHARRIAHRDLRLANLLVDADGRPWLIDFGAAELGASDELVGIDVAELLASTAARVGPAISKFS